MKVLKQVLGIDVAKDELVVSIGKLLEDLSSEIKEYQVFDNNKKGFQNLLKWTLERKSEDTEILFVMESTGVYHEKIAYFLHEKNEKVVIVLPNKISNFMRTLDIKTVNDKTCSIAIAEFGLGRKLAEWVPASPLYKELQQLSREKNQIISERVVCMNQRHAEKAQAFPNAKTLARLEERIGLLKKQEEQIKKELLIEIEKSKETKDAVTLLSTIPGIGKATAIAVLAETNGFELFKNKRQLTSYAGLDIKEKQSGTSVKGKTKISKRGNKNLRKALHYPALTAIKHNVEHGALYHRIVSRTGIKMKGAVAVQRKLLELMYSLYKTQKPYQKNYEENRAKIINEIHPILADSWSL